MQQAEASGLMFLKLEGLSHILEGMRDSGLFKGIQLEREELAASTIHTVEQLLVLMSYVLVGLLCLILGVNRAEIREPLTRCKGNSPCDLILKEVILVKEQHKARVLEAGMLENTVKEVPSLNHLVAKSARTVRPQCIIVTQCNTKDNGTNILKHVQPPLPITAPSTNSYELVPAVIRTMLS
jgi:hypothetical protein